MCRRPAATSAGSIREHHKSARFVLPNPRRERRMIGLFGGSFDPVHHGHLIVGQVASETLGLESLQFVPAREQPFKRGQHRSSPEHRTAMLSLALAGCSGFSLERSELDRPPPSYTVDTLDDLSRRYPRTALVLLLGLMRPGSCPYGTRLGDFPSWPGW